MHHVDVTRAILQTLADIHPHGIQADALAGMVSCEQPALEKELRLLSMAGAVRCAADFGEVQITEAAMNTLRPKSSLR